MNTLISMMILIGCICLGAVLTSVRIIRFPILIARLSTISLYGLLLSMGLRLGSNEEILHQAGRIGLLAISFSLATAVCTAITILFGLRLLKRNHGPRGKENNADKGFREFLSHLKDPAGLLLIVVSGGIIGRIFPEFVAGFAGAATDYLLYLLLFLIGSQLSSGNVDIAAQFRNPAILLIPLATVVGTLLGGLAAGIPFGLSAGKSLALASGFGWYSLSGILISNLGDPILGSAAFLSNIFRESIALLSIPLLARLTHPAVGIGIAGATAMDVTLPLIQKSSGSEYVPSSLTSGAVLSLLVPVLVPLFFQLG